MAAIGNGKTTLSQQAGKNQRESRVARLVFALEKRSSRRSFLPSVALFPAADYFIPVLPNQILLIALSFALPKAWWKLALTFAIAGGFGAILTSLAIQTLDDTLLREVLRDLKSTDAYTTFRAYVRSYGIAALFVFAVLPWPPRTVVAVCAIMGLPALWIGVVVALGRLIPSITFAYLGARSPEKLRRIRFVDRTLTKIEKARLRHKEE